MMWVAIFHLACLALTLELVYRAPEQDGYGLAEHRLDQSNSAPSE